MSTFKAKQVIESRFYELRKFNFLIQIPPGISIGFIVGGMMGTRNWTLIIIGGIIYIIAAYFSFTRLQEFKALYKKLPDLRMDENELLLEIKGKKEKRIALKPGQKMHFQIRTTSLRERIFDYFKKDYSERSANFFKINDTRYDFIFESEFALRKLLTLLPKWEERGIQLSWDFEKAFENELRSLGLQIKKQLD